MRFLCLCALFALLGCSDALGSIQKQVTEITKQCCSDGTSHARRHTDCNAPAQPQVPAMFSGLCLLALDECCKEYFEKKRQCEDGIDTAIRRNNCDGAESESAKTCCQECLKGTTKGAQGTCSLAGDSGSAEDMLLADAYSQCCQKSTTPTSEKNVTDVKAVPLSSDDVSSICEEYAPNELCAHHCIPVRGSYRCECNPGYKLMADGKNCMEVHKNRCKPRNHCQHKCHDNGVEAKCSCKRGYQLQEDGKSCKDIDECLQPVCLPDSTCKNTQGSFKCIPKKKNSEKGQCPPGFTRNVVNNACDDVNECTLFHPPCPSYLCENTVGGYKCGGVSGDPSNLPNQAAAPLAVPAEDFCPTGFKIGANEECEDVDECEMRKDDCNPISQFCINIKGSFYCQDKGSKHCHPGFKIDPSTNKCEDIDECQESSSLCPAEKICVNVPGAYDCKAKIDARSNLKSNCPDGMRMKPGSSVCEDIDECLEGTHLCDHHQSCINTNGSHECRCKPGFEVDHTTGACMDINECATGLNDCMSESQRCDNTVGSYICVRFISCGTGYILHHSTGNCDDIDECALGTHNCNKAGPEYQCKNIPGSFRCVRKERPTTSTTASPEYEYYYVDSDEEIINDTKPETNNQPTQAPTTTTTTTVKLTEATPTISSTASTRPTVEIPYEPKVVIESRLPQIEPESPKPDTDVREREEKVSEPKEDNQPTKEATPMIDEPNKTVDQKREEAEVKEESPPEIVLVDAPKETATVSGVRTDDGGIIVQTEDLEKNTWTKINQKPEVVCQAGFEADEDGACVDIDECATHRHLCSGLTEVCRNNLGGYICECAPGFRRDLVTRACDLIVSTSSTSTSTSTTTSTTTETSNSGNWWGYPVNRLPQRPFRRGNICDAGFHMNKDTGICEDINECTNGLADCAAVEVCVNTQGGYRCECPPNWTLDDVRHRCVPNRDKGTFPPGYKNVNGAPKSDLDQVQVVVGTQHGTPGSPQVEPQFTDLGHRGGVFKCPWGYSLGDDNSCEDIDECALGIANCGPVQICSNLPGGYTCRCPTGHKFVGDHQCEDVDECALAGDVPICSQNAECVNTVGSYQCKCHEGFRSAPANDKVCVDVDECSESRSGSLCQHRCNNVWGGYKCSCHRGYRLNPDNNTCSDVNECEAYKNKNVCVGQCLNEPGSYRCSCPTGYRLAEDKRSCTDIDECETGEATCAKPNIGTGGTDICLNTRGGYRCERITCLPGYRLENKHRCTKMDQRCSPTDWSCLHQPSTYSYNYITFVSKLYIPSAVDLFTMRGPSWVNSRMKFELRLVNVNAPPSVKKKADINSFLLTPTNKHAVVSIVESLEGPQSIELELSMELFSADVFAATAVAKIFIFVSEYDF